jgi:alkylation response protein AidB-like acyl-CoA dehydrogenase
MDASLSGEQEELRRVLRGFLAERTGGDPGRPADAPSRASDPADDGPGCDVALWRALAGTFGLPGVLIPEEYGGLGLGFVELALVQEELGRALVPSPFLGGAVLAVAALLHSGDGVAAKDYLPGIAAGTTVATFAHRPGQLAVRRDGREPVLSGEVDHVLAGSAADLLILPVTAGTGTSLYAVAGDAPGLRRSRLPTIDQTRPQARLRLDGTPARLVGPAGEAAAALTTVRAFGAAALAAEAVGGAARCLELTVEYVRTRHQFGRPVGSFQAVKHRCADLYVEVETARSTAAYAAWAAATLAADLVEAALAAQAYCAGVYRHVAGETIQLHGGIGFTWEHDAHRYLKRATADDLLFGGARHQRAALADRLGW